MKAFLAGAAALILISVGAGLVLNGPLDRSSAALQSGDSVRLR